MRAVYPSLARQAVFITGGASGIGAAFVRAFAGQGARVAFVDCDMQAGRALVRSLASDITHAPVFYPCDVTDTEALADCITQAAEQMGALTVLINNVACDARETFGAVSQDQWRQSMAVNLEPAFFASQAALPHLQAAGGGAILHISSINALFGPANMPSYITAKAGLLGLTKSMARDLGRDRIRVNSILPGWIVTDKQLDHWLDEKTEQAWMHTVCLADRIYPEQVADLALFLAADDARMITSQHFVIDGGRT